MADPKVFTLIHLQHCVTSHLRAKYIEKTIFSSTLVITNATSRKQFESLGNLIIAKVCLSKS